MNTEILKLAAEAEPETMMKAVQAIELTEKIAPEFVPDILADFATITDVTTEKIASIPGIGALGPKAASTAIGIATVVGTGVAASLGSHIAADLFDAAKRGLSKGRNYKRIMDASPNLKNEVIDKSRIRPAFESLHRFAPDFMSDPLMGASLLKALANQPGGNEYQLMEKLIGSRKNLLEIKEKQMRPDWKGAREMLNKARSAKGAPGE